MSDLPIDPAAETVNEGQRADDSYEGQKGYGIQYEDGVDLNGNMTDQRSGSGASGTFETNNTGGYGNTTTDADDNQNSTPATPSTPGGVADQGQGL